MADRPNPCDWRLTGGDLDLSRGVAHADDGDGSGEVGAGATPRAALAALPSVNR
jgi:hypothetical protein